jgi:hypothetical protein
MVGGRMGNEWEKQEVHMKFQLKSQKVRDDVGDPSLKGRAVM